MESCRPQDPRKNRFIIKYIMCFYCSNRRVLGKVLEMGVHIGKLGVHVKIMNL